MIAAAVKFLLILAAAAFLLGVIVARWRRPAPNDAAATARHTSPMLFIAGCAVLIAGLVVGAMAFLSRTQNNVVELRIASAALAAVGLIILFIYWLARRRAQRPR
ncbi:hypothetical protein [Microbacterium sp. YY-01]|uniref:hypothetical protein n=1 Tax=Microbacterium sp. YY-01 TaxID=3421634 RepID=UPI003D16CDDB